MSLTHSVDGSIFCIPFVCPRAMHQRYGVLFQLLKHNLLIFKCLLILITRYENTRIQYAFLTVLNRVRIGLRLRKERCATDGSTL